MPKFHLVVDEIVEVANHRFRVKSLLSRCHTLDCTRCALTAAFADLDSIVDYGIKYGLISIQEEAV